MGPQAADKMPEIKFGLREFKLAKALDTKTLRKINNASIRADRNRTLSNKFFREVDPSGTHVVAAMFVHNDVEVRTMLLAKMRDKVKPVTVFLDMSFSEFDSIDVVYPYAQSDEEIAQMQTQLVELAKLNPFPYDAKNDEGR